MNITITAFTQLQREDVELIQLIREVGYGELTVKLREGKPVIVEKVTQTIKLGDKEKN